MSEGARAEVTVEDRSDGVRIVGVSGELDMSNIDQIDRRLRKEADELDRLVLHLDGLTYIDSSAMRMLDGLRRDCLDRSAQLAIAVGPEAVVRRTLQVSGLDELFSIVDTIEGAVASLD